MLVNKRTLGILLIILATISLSFSLFLYYITNKDYIEYEKKEEKLEERAVEIVNKKDDSSVKKEEIVDLDDCQALKIDWDYLKEVNKDIIGWIYIPETNVNYPILHGVDNKYYERRMFDKSYSIFGSIFIDFRNTGIGVEKNTIIYGHNSLNKTMFAEIANYTNKRFLDNHPVIYIYTPSKNYQIDVFLAYVQDYNKNVYQTNMNSLEDYINQTGNSANKLEYLQNFSIIDGLTTSEDYKIVTLSLCSFNKTYQNPNERVVVQGVIKEV